MRHGKALDHTDMVCMMGRTLDEDSTRLQTCLPPAMPAVLFLDWGCGQTTLLVCRSGSLGMRKWRRTSLFNSAAVIALSLVSTSTCCELIWIARIERKHMWRETKRSLLDELQAPLHSSSYPSHNQQTGFILSLSLPFCSPILPPSHSLAMTQSSCA